jgi:hypothetical protein
MSVHHIALYIGAGSDIRRPFKVLKDVDEFIMIDPLREDMSQPKSVLSEAMMEGFSLKSDGRTLNLRDINPWVFIHPSGRRITYYHSFEFSIKTSSSSPIYKKFLEDAAKAQTLFVAGFWPDKSVLDIMDLKDGGIDFVGMGQGPYIVYPFEDWVEASKGTVIEELSKDLSKVRNILYLPYLNMADGDDVYEYNIVPFEPVTSYQCKDMQELQKMCDEHVEATDDDCLRTK